MAPEVAAIESRAVNVLNEWLRSCTRRNDVSRNTVAVGLVVLHALRQSCPVRKDQIVSDGGEIKGSRGVSLHRTLKEYGVETATNKYVEGVTTRQAHQDGQRLLESLEYGKFLEGIDADARDNLLVELIRELVGHAKSWFQRQHLKVACDIKKSPSQWVKDIITEAQGRSTGAVEQHLVGAKLARRYAGVIDIPNHPSHAGDAQTRRQGDFVVGQTAFHVTAAPSIALMQRCISNIQSGFHPVLLVPADKVSDARGLANGHGIGPNLTILSIEDFIGINVIELSTGDQRQFLDLFRSIIDIYNKRLAEVENNLSLIIEIAG